jgi:phosphoenolpyruvate-protein kinase (PTS system EI component)
LGGNRRRACSGGGGQEIVLCGGAGGMDGRDNHLFKERKQDLRHLGHRFVAQTTEDEGTGLATLR